MAKSSFSLKLIMIDQKMTKIDQKLTSKSDTKIGHNLTIKRGDSGSAGLLEEKCVIIGALKLDTIIDQKSSQTRKMTKNDQKSRKQKSDKNQKMQKVIKSTKS